MFLKFLLSVSGQRGECSDGAIVHHDNEEIHFFGQAYQTSCCTQPGLIGVSGVNARPAAGASALSDRIRSR